MLYTKDYIFLHYPKTAGKTLTRFFLEAWNGEIKGSISKGQLNEVKDLINENIHLEIGRGHETLRQSLRIFSQSFEKTNDPKAIFICVRNPYDLAVSTYFFQKKTYENNKEKENFKLAHNLTLKEYWKVAKTGKPENWFLAKGKTKSPIEFIRFEKMMEDLQKLADKYQFNCPGLSHLNASDRGHYSEYYDSELEKIVYNKFKFFFDKGFYEREKY